MSSTMPTPSATPDELRRTLLEVIGDVAPDADLTTLDPTGDLREQVGLDSIDFLNTVVAVHERTGVEIPERDYPELLTLESFVAYLASHGA
jgi:acyl carrier protein